MSMKTLLKAYGKYMLVVMLLAAAVVGVSNVYFVGSVNFVGNAMIYTVLYTMPALGMLSLPALNLMKPIWIPTRMAETGSASEVRRWMYILIIVAVTVFAVTILFAIIDVILTDFNSSGVSVPSQVNLVKALSPFLPLVGLFLGIFIVIIIVVAIIKWFMKLAETGGGGGA